jgi:hypothetical protein
MTPAAIKPAITTALLALGLAAAATAAEKFTLAPDGFARDAPPGRKADAICGDYVLRNDRLVAVIADPDVWPGRSGSRKSRDTVEGRLIDLTTRDAPSDQLDLFDPVRLPPQGRATNQQRGRDGQPKQELFPDETTFHERPERQSVTAPRVELEMPWLEVARGVTYALEDGKPYLEVRTTLGGGAPRKKAKAKPAAPAAGGPPLACGLLLDADPLDAAHSRTGIAAKGRFFQAYRIGSGQAYGVWSPDATFVRLATIEAHVAGLGLEPDQPGQKTFTQWLLPGRDLFEVHARLAEALGRPTRPLAITVRDGFGPVADAVVEATRAGESVGLGITDADGRLRVQVEPGRLALVVTTGAGQKAEATVDAAAAAEATVELPPAGLLELVVTDGAAAPLPCKAELWRADGPPAAGRPDLGPAAAPGVIGNVLEAADGRIRRRVPPGTYALAVSHGPEHEAWIGPVTIAPGKVAKQEIGLPRVVATPGWVAANFSARTARSRNSSRVAAAERVLALLAENIEFAVAADMDHIGDLAPGVAALGAGRAITVVPGITLTWSGRKYAERFHTVFPLDHRPGRQDGGMPQRPQHVMVRSWLMRIDPKTAPRAVLLQDPLGTRPLCRDLDGDGAADRAWGPDPLDVVDPTDLVGGEAPPGSPAREWLTALGLGERPFAFATAGEADLWHANGRVRTYVEADDADPGRIDPAAVVAALGRGACFPTTGPFLGVSLRGDGPPVGMGGRAASRSGTCTVDVRVQAPARVSIDRVDVLVNGTAAATLRRSAGAAGFAAAPAQFAGAIPLALDRDGFVIVVASGTGPNLGRRAEGSAGRVEAACSNPVWVDVGGDGYRPSRPTPYSDKLIVGSQDNTGSTIVVAPVSAAADAEPGRFLIPITNRTDRRVSGEVKFLLRPAALRPVPQPPAPVQRSIPQYQAKNRTVESRPMQSDTVAIALEPGATVIPELALALAPGRNPGGFWISAPRLEAPVPRAAYGAFFEVAGYRIPWQPEVASAAQAAASLAAGAEAFSLTSPAGERIGSAALACGPAGLAFRVALDGAVKPGSLRATLYLASPEKPDLREFDAFFRQPRPVAIAATSFAAEAGGRVATQPPGGQGVAEAATLAGFLPAGPPLATFKKGQPFLVELAVAATTTAGAALEATLFESVDPQTRTALYGRVTPR